MTPGSNDAPDIASSQKLAREYHRRGPANGEKPNLPPVNVTTTTAATTIAMTFAFNPSGGSIAIGYGVMTLLATAAVLLRFHARRLASVRPGADDHLAAATLLLNYGLLATTLAALGTGNLGGPARGEDAVVTALFKVSVKLRPRPWPEWSERVSDLGARMHARVGREERLD